MAGKGIYLDYQGLEDAAAKLRVEKENFETVVKSMGQIVDSLPDIWEGQTSEKYVEQFADLQPGFTDTKDLIESIATQIDQIVKTVQETDSGMASQVGVQ